MAGTDKKHSAPGQFAGNFRLLGGLALLLLLLSACRSPNPAALPATAAGSQGTAETAAVAAPLVTPTLVQALQPTSTPVAAGAPVNVTQSAPPSPAAPPTLLPTATPTHPLDIQAMRQQSYLGSELTFEETLEPGSNYQRYVVSYLSEGNKIYALLTIPQGERPATGWPVVIFNHGYIPPDAYRTTERYVAYVDAFARNGYIVFRSDYRGHGFSEGEAGGGYSTPDYTVDVLNGMASVLRLPDADGQRVGMWGHSMGGHITLRAMVVSDQIDAGVIWAGVVASYPDLLASWTRPGPTRTPDPESTRRSWRRDLQAQYGSPAENPEFWAAISPNTYAGEISGPIQLHHGTADSDVPVVLSELLYAELQAAGIPSEFYLYEGDNHNIANNLGLALGRSVEFFDRYVKGSGGS